MNAQRITAPRDKAPFAIRYFQPPPRNTAITKDSRVELIPEWGAVLYNFEVYNHSKVLWWKLKKPEAIEGLPQPARLYAEYWKCQGDKPKLLTEVWYATKVPVGCESLAHCIVEIHRQESRTLFIKAPPRTAAHEAARKVMAQLQQEDFPKLALAIKAGHNREAIRRAFIADNRALHGHAPDVEDMRELMRDAEFNSLLSAVRAAPRKTRGQAYALASRWCRDSLHTLTNPDLDKTMNRALNSTYKPGYWPRLARRLGLHRPRGRREKPNLLPPD
jgi:hypothetical protein